MKRFMKYFTLSACSIIIAILSLVFISIISDYPELDYKSTLILPSLFFIFIISAFVSLIILAFEFSSNKPTRKILCIVVSLFILSGISYFAGTVINPRIGRSNYSIENINHAVFAIPANWDKKTFEDDRFTYYYMTNSDFLMVFTDSVNYVLDDTTFDALIEGLLTGSEEYTQIEKGIKEIDSNTFYYLKSSTNIDGTNFIYETYAIQKYENIYVFNMVCKGNEYKYSEDMSKILQRLML